MHFRPIGKTKLMALCSIRHAAAIGIAIAPPAPNSGFRPASGGIYRLERYGQEFAASAPFAYFADHQGELGEKVKHGRLEFLHQFPGLAAEAMQALLPDPTDGRSLPHASSISQSAAVMRRPMHCIEIFFACGGRIRRLRRNRSAVWMVP
jgi:hypothetical protein